MEISLYKGIVNQVGIKLFQEYAFDDDDMLEKLCRDCIHREFMDAVEIVRPLFDGDIRLEEDALWIDVNDDLGEKRPALLGSFDLHRTKQYGKYAFWMSSHVLYDSVCCQAGLEKEPKLLPQKSLWMHELIHMADYAVIRQFRRKMEDGQKGYPGWRPGLRVLNRKLCQEDNVLPREWQFLEIMNHFRCEGLAELHGSIVGLSEPYLKDGWEACRKFRALFDAAFNVFVMPKELKLREESAQHWLELVKTLRHLAYAVGPWMVLDSLAESMQAPKDMDVLARAGAALSGQADALCGPDACLITGRALDMDCGMFLKGLCSPSSEHKWGHFITMNELSEISHYLTMDDAELGEYPNFIPQIIEAGVEKDPARIISCLKEVLGYPMSDAEIDEQMAEFIDADPDPGDIREMVQDLGNRIYRSWQKERKEILYWLLTYLLDPEDWFHDKMPYIGLMDDYYVLSTGYRLSG